jgi:dihydrodipicolinate synthase/N-acetylneuraminate lyase
MLPATVARLCTLDNIVAIKEASGSVTRIRELVFECGDHIAVLSGDDAITAEAMLNGAKGTISVTANVAPQTMHDMCAAALAGDRSLAEDINNKLVPLHKALFLESNPIPVKWAVAQMGLMEAGIRLPLTPLSEHLHADVWHAMEHAGVSSVHKT